MIVLIATDLPEPVAPAISRWGILARSAMTGLPFQVPAQRDRQTPRAMLPFLATRTGLAEVHHPGHRIGHLDPDRPLPGNRRHPDRGRPHGDRHVVGQRGDPAGLDPGAGTTSNCVTTGPVVRPAIDASTLNVRRVSTSFCPSRSSWASSASDVLRRRRAEQVDRRQAGLLGLGRRWCGAVGAGFAGLRGFSFASCLRRAGRSNHLPVVFLGLPRPPWPPRPALVRPWPLGPAPAFDRSPRPSKRFSGCQAIVRMVRAERSRNAQQQTAGQPDQIRDAVGQEPGRDAHARARASPSAPRGGSKRAGRDPRHHADDVGHEQRQPAEQQGGLPHRDGGCPIETGDAPAPARAAGAPARPAPRLRQRKLPDGLADRSGDGDRQEGEAEEQPGDQRGDGAEAAPGIGGHAPGARR